ncbi:MAG: helix-turn-helix transcriptional regulator, partial [Clostridia bacterium]|nr:helix-turn-helix transcriptional regulator [Clostridia bacterium]
KEYNEKQPGYHEMMRCQLIEILIDSIRQVPQSASTSDWSGMVQYITDQVNKNFMEKLSLSSLAQECCYSLAYVSKVFKEEMGMTFQDYLQKVRVHESCRLLANTSKKISEICGLVGYTDVKFFNQIFKKQTGMTPREFRKQRKETLL